VTEKKLYNKLTEAVENVGHGMWGASAHQAATSPKTYELIMPRDVSRRCEALFDVMDRRCEGCLKDTLVKEAVGPDWALVSLEMDQGDGSITVEAWMRFFNRTWGTAPNNVFLIFEAMESRLTNEQVMKMGHFQATVTTGRSAPDPLAS
jgi:hypothetical protein